MRTQIDAQKLKIQAALITESDDSEAWLDGEGNPVDEEHVIDLLGNASDYHKALSDLRETDKNVVERLAGAITAPAL